MRTGDESVYDCGHVGVDPNYGLASVPRLGLRL